MTPEYQQVPIPPEPKKGPSCWTIGGIGCVVVILVIAILAFVGVQKLLSSKEGKEIVGTVQNAMRGAKEAVACKTKLEQIDSAIMKRTARILPRSRASCRPTCPMHRCCGAI